MNYQEYRDSQPSDTSVEVVSCTCEVYPEEDGRRARYQFSFNIRNVSAENEESWVYTVPTAADNVSVEAAKDDTGGLQTSKQPGANGSCEIIIRYRAPLAKGATYTFEFAYTAKMRSLCTDEGVARTVIAYNWLVHGHVCRSQTVRVHLPKRAKLLESSPPPSEVKEAVAYSTADLRPREPFTVLCAYRRFALGATSAIWVVSAMGTGAIGYMVGYFIGLTGLK